MASYKTIAEPGRAQEKAIFEVQRILDVIRYAIPILYSSKDRVRVGLQGDIGAISRAVFSLSGDGKQVSFSEERVGAFKTFEINESNLEKKCLNGALYML